MLSRSCLSVFIAGVIALIGCGSAFAQSDFTPATFQGLVLGKATFSEVTQLLGIPGRTWQDDRRGYLWVYYRDIGPIAGRLEMYMNSKTMVLEDVVIFPEPLLSVADAQKRLGGNFRTIHYDFDNCLDNGGEAPLYESPDGSLEFLVSATSGIIIYADSDHEHVSYISYMSRPIGAKASRCKSK
jgi:hypothetical protein